MTPERIFVKIAAYRDPELLKTVSSLLAAAEHPRRIDFGIVNQVGDETRGQLDSLRADARFTIYEFDWTQSLGLGWARNMCDQMWQGQAFSLQIDSHMRFRRGWDTQFITDWRRTADDMAVLSCYPAIYGFNADGSEFYEHTLPHQIEIQTTPDDGIPRLHAGPDTAPLTPGVFVAGGLQFNQGTACRDVPNLPEVFYGDETAHSVRLFTHGYNVYAPSDVTAYHLYERHKWMNVHYWHQDMMQDPALARRYRNRHRLNMDTMRELLTDESSVFAGTHRGQAKFWNSLPNRPQQAVSNSIEAPSAGL
ncbi:hypothetical protein GCM10009847_06760 [Leucobacter tardus]|uniref:Glycosyltransferase (GlcNAc) n=1 Tax=Leucobacter tardus TaxID=501483 RepID=A0A939QHC7_9MICO|nr:GlcNAc-transferase family protein [Leucobacter tardus]MBO2988879.1 hypothetical protein [Leucobacter tardus]